MQGSILSVNFYFYAFQRGPHQAQIYGFKYSLHKLMLSKYTTLGSLSSDLQTYILDFHREIVLKLTC